MAITLADFNKIWASTSPLTPYSFSEANYKQGWNFVGSTPPARQMWDFLQKNNDEKMQYLANNYLPLSGGTMTGDIVFSKTDFAIKASTDTNSNNLWGGTNWSKGAYLSLYGADHASYPGWFRLYARNSTTSVELRGKPDGTLTWGGKAVNRGVSYIVGSTGLGYEKNEANGTVKQWSRIGVNGNDTNTWTFSAPMGNAYYYVSAVGENGNNISITAKTETSITIQNNGSTYCNVECLVIGIPASQ